MIEIFAPPLRILLMAAFLLIAKQGWFTWLTPESAHEVANQLMDFLVLAVPAGYAAWAYFKAKRAARPDRIIAKAAALSEVDVVVVANRELAASIPNDKVIP